MSLWGVWHLIWMTGQEEIAAFSSPLTGDVLTSTIKSISSLLAEKAKIMFQARIRTVVEFRGWKFLLQICYDFRFPVFSRNNPDDAYDAIIYVANWPKPRIHAWRTLLQARAIENQCYVIGVNRCREDPSGNIYTGDSLGVDPWGVIASEGPVVDLVCERGCWMSLGGSIRF